MLVFENKWLPLEEITLVHCRPRAFFWYVKIITFSAVMSLRYLLVIYINVREQSAD